MSLDDGPDLLSFCAGGLLLDAPTDSGTRCTEAESVLRARILEALLPAQREFVQDEAHRLLAYVGGFGAGKTFCLNAKALFLGMANPGSVAAVFEPTHILIRDVWVRSFSAFLDEQGIEFDFRISPQPEYVVHLPTGTFTLLCRATETWNRIRGQTLSFVLVDEIDTSPLEVAQKAVEMMLARLRGGSVNQLAVGSTPEGYRWLHRTFVEEIEAVREDPDRLAVLQKERRLIRVSTRDNHHLPDGFIESLYSNYPPALIASYIDGHFTNLAQSSVYPYFDRDVHWTDEEIQPTDRLFIGVDFNVGACFCEVIVRRGSLFLVLAEHHPADTQKIARVLAERYPQQYADKNIVIIPDASSRHRSTTGNASVSDRAILTKAGFNVKVQGHNPAIEDRVNATNVLLMNKRLLINPKVKYLTRSLEQQAYDKNGKPEKQDGGGLSDVSGPVDAAGYALFYLAGLRPPTGSIEEFRVW